MRSSCEFPICRVNWRPGAMVMYCVSVAASLAVCSVAVSGISLVLKAGLVLLAIGYAVISVQRYKSQAAVTLVSNGRGALFLTHDGARQALEQVAWRDWGFIIELQARMRGEKVIKFWLTARLNPMDSRQLRLLMRAQCRKAGNSLPSIITNPVL